MTTGSKLPESMGFMLKSSRHHNMPLQTLLAAAMLLTAALTAQPVETPTPAPQPSKPAAQSAPKETPPATAPLQMSPEMMRRYGLTPKASGQAAAATNVADAKGTGEPPQFRMDPALMRRYGLIPPGNQHRPSPPQKQREGDDRPEWLKQGLFEEEANRNPTAALPHYQRIADAYTQQRTNAATALFRLAECYRKLARTNDAIGAYQRVVNEFPEREDLNTLARQSLSSLGAKTAPQPSHQPAPSVGIAAPPTIPPPGAPMPGRSGFYPHPTQPISVQRWQWPSAKTAAELKRTLAFIESKQQAGPEEVVASAVRLVFNDPELASKERQLDSFRARLDELRPKAGTAGELGIRRGLVEAMARECALQRDVLIATARLKLQLFEAMENAPTNSAARFQAGLAHIQKHPAGSESRSHLIRALTPNTELHQAWLNYDTERLRFVEELWDAGEEFSMEKLSVRRRPLLDQIRRVEEEYLTRGVLEAEWMKTELTPASPPGISAPLPGSVGAPVLRKTF